MIWLAGKYMVRGLLLASVPLSGLVGVLLPGQYYPWTKTALLAAIPVAIVILVAMDLWEILKFRQDVSIPYEISPLHTSANSESSTTTTSTLARHGRDNLHRMLPPKTNKRYLIVGVGGVGRRIITMLQQRGDTDVYGIDKNETQDIKDLLGDRFLCCNVTDAQACRKVVQHVRPDVVFHTAAVIASYAHRKAFQWPATYNVNVQGVKNMLQACTESSSVRVFILTSSSNAGLSTKDLHSAVEGDENRFAPVTSPDLALNWYTRSKALAETEALKHCHTHDSLPLLGIIRPASGIFHHLDALVFREALDNMHAAAIGFEYRQIDWIFLDNVVLGHLLLEKQLHAGKCAGETFLISNQEPVTGLEFFRRLAAFAPDFVYWKMSTTVVFLLASLTELVTLLGFSMPGPLGALSYATLNLSSIDFVMDDSKAQRELGYKPAFTVNEGILQMMEDHQREFPHGKLAASNKKTS